jgi:hypothetical protein
MQYYFGKLITINLNCVTVSKANTWAQYNETFNIRLKRFVKSYTVCPWQGFPEYSMGKVRSLPQRGAERCFT